MTDDWLLSVTLGPVLFLSIFDGSITTNKLGSTFSHSFDPASVLHRSRLLTSAWQNVILTFSWIWINIVLWMIDTSERLFHDLSIFVYQKSEAWWEQFWSTRSVLEWSNHTLSNRFISSKTYSHQDFTSMQDSDYHGFIPYKVDFSMSSVGKYIKQSKRKCTWKFGFAHIPSIESGKSDVECRGKEMELNLISRVQHLEDMNCVSTINLSI